MSANDHPWSLVGPWYRWAEPGSKASGRASVPVIQKYASPGLVQEFLEEPQRCLEMLDKDFVHVVTGGGSRFSLSGQRWAKAQPECRKLFLDVHGRFYLVVCELHCDTAGFPSAARDQVCEAGFAVRRRKANVPPAIFEEVVALLESTAAARAEIAELRQLRTVGGAAPPWRQWVAEIARGDCDRRLSLLLKTYIADSEALEELSQAHGVGLAHQGWVEGDHQGIGAWVDVEETPQDLVETVYPLYPLIPDPGAEGHSAAGRSLFFGVVPTSTAEVDGRGEPRFDDRSLYQIRGFVRRHQPPCPRTAEPGDCKGALVWSRGTEKYRLAAPNDLDGTGQRPVTIPLPDLAALAAQADGLKPGEGANVRMVTPPESSLPSAGDDLANLQEGSPGSTEICFFAIPLITIVASFVLRLFLPILVFLFGLWFLLRLKFCIPPSLSLSGGASLDLALAGELGLKIEADVDIDVSVAAELGLTVAELEAKLEATLEGALGATVAGKLLADPELGVGTERRNRLTKLVLDLGADFRAEAPPELVAEMDPAVPAGPLASLPDPAAELTFCPVLEVPAP